MIVSPRKAPEVGEVSVKRTFTAESFADWVVIARRKVSAFDGSRFIPVSKIHGRNFRPMGREVTGTRFVSRNAAVPDTATDSTERTSVVSPAAVVSVARIVSPAAAERTPSPAAGATPDVTRIPVAFR
ncbi:MAG: hypothetical protein KatS3mg014_2666 [Actinomycetota bacterium]|nr:MAG: hypothetical protein KatS3mg014_2666 [Actinomycetota bacterium]